MNDYQTRRQNDDAGWREKACARCGAPVRYHRDWDEPPALCRKCAARENAMWREKVCPRCGSTFRYHREWDAVPTVCGACREKDQRVKQRAKQRRGVGS
jgi:hypothetical protein